MAENTAIDLRANDAWKNRLNDLQNSYREGVELLELCESLNYSKGIADSCKLLGYCYWRFSDYSLSLSHSIKALKVYEELRDKKGEADTLNNIGAVYMFQNDHENRLKVNLRCKEIRSEVGDLEGIALSEGNIGETYLEMGDFEKATVCFNNVLNDKNSIPQAVAWAYQNLGVIAEKENDFERSLFYYNKSLELSVEVNYDVLISESQLSITNLYINQKKYNEAISSAEVALEKSRINGAKEGEKNTLYYLSQAYELIGEFKTSLRYHKDYHKIAHEISRDTEIERLKTTQLKVAYDKIDDQRNELIDSIRYAERIQSAVLTRAQSQELVCDYFVFYEPKNIVSGDFYWYFEKNDFYYMCVGDCTGHGVPGAFLTMLGTTFLNEIILLSDDLKPSDILDQLRDRLIKALSQKGADSNRDGMDISLIRVNVKTFEAQWAGAYNPIWIVRNENEVDLQSDFEAKKLIGTSSRLFELKGDKQPIANSELLQPFKNNTFQLIKGDVYYLFSDGYADQFGGEKGKKMMTLNFKKELLKINHLPFSEKQGAIAENFKNWKGNMEQTDDVCVVGVMV